MGDDDKNQGRQSDSSQNNEANLYDHPDAAPSPARMIEVTSGRSQWTPEEKAWLALHPKWIEHELKTRAMLKMLDGQHPRKPPDAGGQRDGFINRIKAIDDNPDRNEPTR